MSRFDEIRKKPGASLKIDAIRKLFMHFEEALAEILPADTAEKRLAILRLEESFSWAEKSILRHQPAVVKKVTCGYCDKEVPPGCKGVFSDAAECILVKGEQA